jgi:hypothetical protein
MMIVFNTGACNIDGLLSKAVISELVMRRHGHVPLWDRPQSAANHRFEIGLKLV